MAPKGEEDGQSPKEEEGATNESSIDDTKNEKNAEEASCNTEAISETDGTSVQLTSEQERTYANLQPIFLAMEMGQDAVQVHQTEEQQHQEGTTEEMEQRQTAFIATTSEFTNTTQAASMLLSNVTTTGAEPPASLASILQDVVSGMQSSSGSVPAAIITDPSSSSGSFLIVNQNGVPIVRPVLVSNLPGGGVGASGAVSVSAETLQVLTAGLQAVDDGTAGSAQETVAVDVGASTEGRLLQIFFSGAIIVEHQTNERLGDDPSVGKSQASALSSLHRENLIRINSIPNFRIL